ncbi:hypothetical protein HK103_007588 [Boothiomyces macroporosus]|uniref:Uncharacterized protein n=1 Tax=Boothiomyces macroporosus TaxID=261099 RepID=A0AAD5UG73_9FUNG|nr:hypothetical protein HK103_007588 [Boothiomyces macroporosus]
MSADCPVFYRLYKAMGGTDPTLTETNCCDWRDPIKCSGGRLQQIYLNENQLNGTITREIGKLDGLRLFSVAANNLTGELPPEMAKLSFSVLDIDENNFYGQIPAIQVNTSFGTPRFEMYLNSFSGYIPDSLANANITTIDPGNNNGCPYDSNLCVKTKPLHCENVDFNCTTLPHRFYPDSQTSSSDSGLFAHPLKLIIGIVAIVAVLSLCAIGITFYVSRKKKPISPDSSSYPFPKLNDDIKLEDTQRFVGQQVANSHSVIERQSKGNFSSGTSETAISQYSPSLSTESPLVARQPLDRGWNDTVSARSSKSTFDSRVQSLRQTYRDSSRIPGTPTSSVGSYHSSPRNISPATPANYPSEYPRKYASSIGSPLINPALINSPTITHNVMPPLLFDDSGISANQEKSDIHQSDILNKDEEDTILPPLIHQSFLKTPDDRRDSETLPPVIRHSFLRRNNPKDAFQ